MLFFSRVISAVWVWFCGLHQMFIVLSSAATIWGCRPRTWHSQPYVALRESSVTRNWCWSKSYSLTPRHGCAGDSSVRNYWLVWERQYLLNPQCCWLYQPRVFYIPSNSLSVPQGRDGLIEVPSVSLWSYSSVYKVLTLSHKTDWNEY